MDNKDNPLPTSARVFPLRKGTKQPATRNGHLDASSSDLANVIKGDYGIALDGQFVVVDVDYPEKLKDDARFQSLLGTTWTQQTKKGYHMLFAVPKDFKGKNARLPNQAGDIKVNGYIVGPGSVIDGHTYSVLNSGEPTKAPKWLLDMVAITGGIESSLAGPSVEKELQVKEGEGRNQFLTRVAGSLRNIGLGVDQTKKILRSVNQQACQPPVSEIELRTTIDHSIEKWSQGVLKDVGPLNREGWINASDIPRVTPPISWWEWGFIPRGILALQYGRGGIGKSTLAAWLSAKVTRDGGRFGVVTREDPFSLFANRAILSGAIPELLWAPKCGDMVFPRDADGLHQIIKELELDFLYFDSIYDHFQPMPDSNMAEKARSSLSPLAHIATETGCTILGTFHTNKSGRFMGSTEMENVSRILLETTRGEAPDAPLTVGVEKSNFKKPDFKLQFKLLESTIVDPITGEVQMEQQRDGTMGKSMLSYAQQIENMPKGHVNIDSVSEWVTFDDLF